MAEEQIAVIGGGITGLAASYELQKKIQSGNLDAQFTLYEGSGRLGGVIRTDYTNGFVIEQGPDSFLTRKRSMYNLTVELGLEKELVTNQSGAYILHESGLQRMPEGAVMGIPTKLRPFLTTGLFSMKGKIRAGMDLFLPRGKAGQEDQSVGDFFRRRLGNEVVDHLIEPLLSGIYAGRIDNLSLQATFPQFQEIENKHRSLILGMRNVSGSKTPQEPVFLGEMKKPANMFLTLRGGLQSLVDRLEKELDEKAVMKNKKLIRIEKEGKGIRLHFEDGSDAYADKVLLTTRHHEAYELFKEMDFMEPMGKVPSTSVATVALAYDSSAMTKPLNGTGFVIPKKAGYTITACTWTHHKWEHTAPEGKALLRAYVGRAGEEEIVSKSDKEIVEAVRRDLKEIMGIEAEPELHLVTRWRNAMPQYEVGHRERLQAIEKKLAAEYPAVKLLGASYRGIGLPDCIDQAVQAVEEI